MATTKKTQSRGAKVKGVKGSEDRLDAIRELLGVQTTLLSTEETAKLKESIFRALSSYADRNNAATMMYSKAAMVLGKVDKIISDNYQAVNELFQFKVRKLGSDLKSRYNQPALNGQHPKHFRKGQGTPVQPQTTQPAPAQPTVAAQPQHKPPRREEPLKHNFADKLKAAGHVPDAPKVETPPPTETQAPAEA